MKNTEGLRFESLEVEHFKSIDKKIVNINGRSLLITGKNSAGKSSLIQALLSGIDPKIQPTDSIKKGEKSAKTTVVLSGNINGQPEEYSIEMFYTPANQSGRIVLKNSKGETVKSPKEVLKSIIGNISFDIFTFLKSKKADQLKILKELSGVAPEMNKLDFERKAIYDERTFLNRTVSESEAVMNNHGFTPQEIELYSEPILIEPLQEEMAGISKKITDWNGVKIKKEQFEVDVVRHTEKISEFKERIAEMVEKIQSLKESIVEREYTIQENKEKIKKGEEWLAKNHEPKAEEISQKVSDAVEHNAKHEKIKELVAKQKSLYEDKQRLEKMNQDIEVVDNKKDSLIKNSKLPVKGLTFSDSEIFLDGLPLEENQVNTARLIDIGAEIAMALNPSLKTIFIHEGSLFDKESLNNLIKKVEAKGYQIIAELVSESNELGVEFIEMEA